MLTSDVDFDAFYRGTASRVVHLVYATTGDLRLAQDCTQEAYARAWQRWSTVSRADDPLSWVRTVARRLAISSWRKNRNRQEAQRLIGEIGSLPAPSEDRVAVVRALRELPRPVREAVTMHYIADLTVEQIAHETRTPTGTIKARLHRGRAQLARALRPQEARHQTTHRRRTTWRPSSDQP
jgi:RNA polymerase sigma factor (sigma-70 family)